MVFAKLIALISILILTILTMLSGAFGESSKSGGLDSLESREPRAGRGPPKRAPRTTHHNIARELDSLRPFIGELIKMDPPQMVRVNDIPGKAPYFSTHFPHRSTHVGQLKLFLSEVQFLTRENRHAESYVIYAGSGPGHTRQMLANMFPHIKFILIDPQEHDIKGSDSSERLYFRYPAHVSAGSAKINIATTSGIIAREKRIPMTPEEQLAPDEIARVILEHPEYTFYIIEDLFTDDLARALRKLSSARPIYFISDIRTSINVDESKARKYVDDPDNSPTDLDILVNNAWQHTWVNTIQPAACMLKFRAPYYNPGDLQLIARYSGESRNDMYGETLRAYKARFGVDLIAEYNTRRYLSLGYDYMNLQAFPGSSSSEVRLISTPTKYNTIIEYNTRAFEDQMFYYNLMRDYCFSRENSAHFDAIPGLDGCQDCRLAVHIMEEYCAGDQQLKRAPKHEAIALLKELLKMIGRTIRQENHGHFFQAYSDYDAVVRDVIACNEKQHGEKLASRMLRSCERHR